MPRLFLTASVKANFNRTRAGKWRILLHKQGPLNCPQFGSFFYAYKIILNSNLKICRRAYCLIDSASGLQSKFSQEDFSTDNYAKDGGVA